MRHRHLFCFPVLLFLLCSAALAADRRRMLVGLGQADSPDDVRAAMAAGWPGDLLHTYRTDQLAAWFAAVREAGQLAEPSIKTSDLDRLDDIATVILQNTDILWGVNLEGTYVEDDAALRRVLDRIGRRWCIVYHNNTALRGDAWRYSRLWYPDRRKQEPPAEAKDNIPVQRLYFAAVPEAARQPVSLYPLRHLAAFGQNRHVQTSIWLQGYGQPAENPTHLHDQHGSPIRFHAVAAVQPRVDALWRRLVMCDWLGIGCAKFYTFSLAVNDEHCVLPEIDPPLWGELCEAVRDFKTGLPPTTHDKRITWFSAPAIPAPVITSDP